VVCVVVLLCVVIGASRHLNPADAFAAELSGTSLVTHAFNCWCRAQFPWKRSSQRDPQSSLQPRNELAREISQGQHMTAHVRVFDDAPQRTPSIELFRGQTEWHTVFALGGLDIGLPALCGAGDRTLAKFLLPMFVKE
jgi:hypothetical protein